jgi:hypothetical protein
MLDEDRVMEMKPITGDAGGTSEDRSAGVATPTAVAVVSASVAAEEIG